MKKKYYFAIIPFILGIGCFVAYSIIGSKIAPDGTLVEPFGLIPVGFFLVAIGTIIAVVMSGLALFHNPLKFDKWIFGLSLGFIILASLYLFASMSYLSERAKIETTQPPVASVSDIDVSDTQPIYVEKDFEGEADPSRMTLGMNKWRWIKAQYNDGKSIEPKKDVFSLTFKNDGTFGATTDCNSVGGSYTATKSTITFSKIMSTEMYCEGSQESDFIKILENTDGYIFTSKGELVLNLKFDSGSVYFR